MCGAMRRGAQAALGEGRSERATREVQCTSAAQRSLSNEAGHKSNGARQGVAERQGRSGDVGLGGQRWSWGARAARAVARVALWVGAGARALAQAWKSLGLNVRDRVERSAGKGTRSLCTA